MRNAREVITATFTIMAISLGMSTIIPAGVIIYWSMDRGYPMDLVQGRFEGWENISPPIVKIRWTGSRERMCPGKSEGLVFTDTVFPLPERILPQSNLQANIGKGQVVWSESIRLPDTVLETPEPNLFLTIRFSWECNPLQHYWPIVINAPRINIPLPRHMPGP